MQQQYGRELLLAQAVNAQAQFVVCRGIAVPDVVVPQG